MTIDKFLQDYENSTKSEWDQEKLLYLFTTALDKGDFDAVLAIQAQGTTDSNLRKMLDQITDAFYAEAVEASAESAAELVQTLAAKHLTDYQAEETTEDLPPLTIGDVLARMQADIATSNFLQTELAQVRDSISKPDTVLPESLSLAQVKLLLLQLGLRPTDKFLKVFREKAIFLTMNREQGVAQLAAARRQRQNRQFKPK